MVKRAKKNIWKRKTNNGFRNPCLEMCDQLYNQWLLNQSVFIIQYMNAQRGAVCVILLCMKNPCNLIGLLVIMLQFVAHTPYFVQIATLARLVETSGWNLLHFLHLRQNHTKQQQYTGNHRTYLFTLMHSRAHAQVHAVLDFMMVEKYSMASRG